MSNVVLIKCTLLNPTGEDKSVTLNFSTTSLSIDSMKASLNYLWGTKKLRCEGGVMDNSRTTIVTDEDFLSIVLYATRLLKQNKVYLQFSEEYINPPQPNQRIPITRVRRPTRRLGKKGKIARAIELTRLAKLKALRKPTSDLVQNPFNRRRMSSPPPLCESSSEESSESSESCSSSDLGIPVQRTEWATLPTTKTERDERDERDENDSSSSDTSDYLSSSEDSSMELKHLNDEYRDWRNDTDRAWKSADVRMNDFFNNDRDVRYKMNYNLKIRVEDADASDANE
jgi:hypothetical protein